MTVQQVMKVLEEQIDLNQFILMYLVNSNQDVAELRNSVKVKGWITMMIMKDYLEEVNGKLSLTEKGKEIMIRVGSIEILTKVDKLLLSNIVKNIPSNTEYDYEYLQRKLKDNLKKLTGRTQYMLKVQGNEYSYLPSVNDLKNRIEKFKSVYKMTDMNIIEKCLIRHTGIRNQKMVYYIMREKGDAKSDLSSDYENFDENNNKSTGLGGTVSI